MRKPLLFCFNLTKMLLRAIACFRKHIVNMLYLKQRAEIGLESLKVAISTLKTKNVEDSRNNLKMKTSRAYSMKIAVRLLKDCLIHNT